MSNFFKRNPPPQPPYSDRVIARQATQIAGRLSEVKTEFAKLEDVQFYMDRAKKQAKQLIAYSQLGPAHQNRRISLAYDTIDSLALIKSYADDFIRELQPIKRQIESGVNPLKTIKPSATNIYHSLKALQNSGGYKYENGIISTTTKYIELEGVKLGSFEIQLNTHPQKNRNPTDQCTIIALDDFGVGDYIHPHVDSGTLCFGEQKAAANSAARRGDYDAFFEIVEALLDSYNEDSCYRNLDNWHLTCEGCERELDEDAKYTCEDSGDVLCRECVRTTASGHDYAERFVRWIEGREEYYHRDDTRQCNSCDEWYYRNDLEAGLCSSCHEDEETARADAAENDDEGERIYHPSRDETHDIPDCYRHSKFVPLNAVYSGLEAAVSNFAGDGQFRYLPDEAEFRHLMKSVAHRDTYEEVRAAIAYHIGAHHNRHSIAMESFRDGAILTDRIQYPAHRIWAEDRAWMALAFIDKSENRYTPLFHVTLISRLERMYVTPLEAVEIMCLIRWHLEGWSPQQLNEILSVSLTSAERDMAYGLAIDLPRGDIESIADIESLAGDDCNLIAVAKYLAGHIHSQKDIEMIRISLHNRVIQPISTPQESPL